MFSITAASWFTVLIPYFNLNNVKKKTLMITVTVKMTTNKHTSTAAQQSAAHQYGYTALLRPVARSGSIFLHKTGRDNQRFNTYKKLYKHCHSSQEKALQSTVKGPQSSMIKLLMQFSVRGNVRSQSVREDRSIRDAVAGVDVSLRAHRSRGGSGAAMSRGSTLVRGAVVASHRSAAE